MKAYEIVLRYAAFGLGVRHPNREETLSLSFDKEQLKEAVSYVNRQFGTGLAPVVGDHTKTNAGKEIVIREREVNFRKR